MEIEIAAHQQSSDHGYDHQIYDQISDCESSVSSSLPTEEEHQSRGSLLFEDDLIKLNKDGPVFKLIKGKLMSKLGVLGNNMRVVSIHKKNWSGFVDGEARLRCFGVRSEVLGHNVYNNGVKFAWYGGSKDDILRIISNGFGNREVGAQYDDAVCLFSTSFPILSVQNCEADDNGLRHLLLCRVLVGNMELLEYGSRQCHPRRDYDCGVDDVVLPTKYIVWSTKINTHILPEYVVSFKAPLCLMGLSSRAVFLFNKKPNSPWMPIPTLISKLSNFVTPQIINFIKKLYRDLKNQKISRRQFIHAVRELVEDEILIAIIKSFTAKLRNRS